MEPIIYIDRTTGKQEQEKVFGGAFLRFLYGDSLLSKTLGRALLPLVVKNPLFSSLYGWWQNQSWTARSVLPFIKKYEVDDSEFLEPAQSFRSFNDFFVRKLKPEARLVAPGDTVAVIPADGRYLFHQRIDRSDGFVIKGEKFHLPDLLQDEALAEEFDQGSMVMARLCPTDYHRFHFPCACVPGETRLINGWLYSVNPVAIKKDIHIFSQNKRTLTVLQTKRFGKVLYLEIGATSVGTIVETYIPNQPQDKGAEKGYFSFGGSSLILLFEPGAIQFDADLLKAYPHEIRCLMGQSMGRGIGF